MLSLPMVKGTKGQVRLRNGKMHTTLMPREELRVLTRQVLACPSLVDAAALLRKVARSLPTLKGGWGYHLLRLAVGLHQETPAFRVFMKGNTKLPFYAFSTLPEFTCPGAGECLQWCYSFTAWRQPTAWGRQVQNTLLLRHKPAVVARAFRKIPRGRVLRLYVDGDFDSARTVHFWMRQLARRPDLRVYGYSKSWRLLWNYARNHEVPANYVLNLSSGGKDQGVSREQMLSLPFVRGEFLALPIDYHPGVRGNIGFKRYADPDYHRATRKAAADAGLRKVFACPGRCGECCGGNHACGLKSVSLPVVIGIH